LACTECKSIEDFHWDAFEEIKLPVGIEKWGDIEKRHVVLKGTCKACRSESPTDEE
jgi:Fe2+ or Zn2+ uptake regulation protein